MAAATRQGSSLRCAKSSAKGTSIAKSAPVAGALKIAATPAAAPAVMSTRLSTGRNSQPMRRCTNVPTVPPAKIESPSSPIAPPKPIVSIDASTPPGPDRTSMSWSGSWNAFSQASARPGGCRNAR